MIFVQIILVAIIAYLIGSIPFGYLIARRGGIDITQHGSGRMGATNVLRTMGRKTAFAVALLDIIKGVLAVVIAGLVVGREVGSVGSWTINLLSAQVIAGLAAVCGHIWPVFHSFKGGRGVATFFGGFIALYPAAAIFGGEAFIISAGISGFASLGSITGVVGAYAILIPLTVFSGFPVEYLAYALIGGTLIVLLHRDNLKRLIAGKERKLSEKA